MNDRIRGLQAWIAIEEARLAVFKKYKIDLTAERTMLDQMKKMVEDEKKMALAEVNRPLIIQPTRKSWQDNIWLFLVIGIIIGVVVLIVGQAIIKGM